MNVIISNEQQEVLSGLNIEVIKNITGVHSADEIVEMFSNFFFGKMVFDVTALDGYKDPRSFQKISISLDVEKIILLLPNIPECNDPRYISKLISMGFYNFTTNIDGLNYLISNPNSYRDVAHLHVLEEQVVVEHPGQTTVVNNYVEAPSSRIIGIKNLTQGAGATTLTYLLKKQLSSMGISNVVIEINKKDFMYLNDKDLVSVNSDQLSSELMKNRNAQVILLDLNDYQDTSICSDIIYLLEPSVIKLNKLMIRDRGVFNRLRGSKIVLAKSVLSSSDIAELEYEAKTKFFFNLPPIDDRKETSDILETLLSKLGVIKY